MLRFFGVPGVGGRSSSSGGSGLRQGSFSLSGVEVGEREKEYPAKVPSPLSFAVSSLVAVKGERELVGAGGGL